jgi:tetratricopeptide (TPR) repeat protein
VRKMLYFLVLLSVPIPAFAEREESRPLDCSHVMAWVIGGMPQPRLQQIAHERGLDFVIGQQVTVGLLMSGAEPELVQNLRTVKRAQSNPQPNSCPPQLALAGELVHQKQYEQAEPLIQGLIAFDPNNSALRFALGYIEQQQSDWDAAFDAYLDSRNLMPGLADTHARLAYVFYHYDDGDNAIAEARSALSIDPKNPEPYRYLGLGFYANQQYAYAIHAFEQSLALEPDNPDTYYDMGITLASSGDLSEAAAAYRKAIALHPQFWEAYSDLGMLEDRIKHLDATPMSARGQ